MATKSHRVYEYKLQRTRSTLIASEAVADFETLANELIVARLARAVVGNMPREHLLSFYVDRANRVIGYEVVSFGSDGNVSCAPAELLRSALLSGASGVILVHNHPSGLAQPSADDDALTREVAKALKLIGLQLLDHVIVTENTHYSYASDRKVGS